MCEFGRKLTARFERHAHLFETFERFHKENGAQWYSTKTSSLVLRVKSGTVNPSAG